MVSLPKEWVDKNGLEKNSEVDVETGINSVSISAGSGIRPSSEIEIQYPPVKDENIAASLTGAYLLGYDIIRIRSKSSIPADEREKIRSSMRRLVGMEIVEEDAATVDMQFLPDAATLNPQKILKRMSNIVLGMFDDVTACLLETNRSNLLTMENRDNEVNRQYFLLVRLVRSTMADKRLHSAFNLENIDILDYRIAAHLLEDAGDTVVQLALQLHKTSMPPAYLKKIHGVAEEFACLKISIPTSHGALQKDFLMIHSGYWISISLEGRIPDPAEIDFIPVSTSTSEFFSRPFLSTHWQ